MIKGSLTEYFDDLDRFNQSIKDKIALRQERYRYGNIITTQELKRHMIEEILEFFLITDKEEKTILMDYFMSCNIDVGESKDVAALAWSVELSETNGIL